MTAPEVDRLLQEGIDAVKRGEAAQARELLLQVVNADENSEAGWFWLSYVIDDPQDKIVALENVLTLNPGHRAAQQNLDKWRAQLAGAADTVTPPAPVAAAAPAPVPAPVAAIAADDFIQKYAPHSPTEYVSNIDDIYQCVYCGAPAKQAARKCPACGRALYRRRTLSYGMSYILRSAIFTLTALFGLAAVQGLLIASVVFQGRNSFLMFVLNGMNVNYYIGDYILQNNLNLTAPVSLQVLLWIAVVRVGIILLLMAGLAAQFTPAYYTSIVFLSLDIVWTICRWVFKFSGPVGAIIDIITDIIALSFIFGSDREFAVNEERLLCEADPRLKGGAELNRRARLARMEGKWALAVAYWRAAVAAMPHQSEFYKSLSIGYAQIGYYQRGLNAITEAGRQSPADTEIPRIKELIEVKQKGDPQPRG